jgi:serine/threonine protein kinase
MASYSTRKLGSGSYGQVFSTVDGNVIKYVDKICQYDPSGTNMELTTICESAILNIPNVRNIPKVIGIYDMPYGKSGIKMENCGITLLDAARLTEFSERMSAVPEVAFQLIQAALDLNRYGVFHNDIKIANVMVQEGQENFLDLTLIDFGICGFETVGAIDEHLKSNGTTAVQNHWGTYCICPPEAFMHKIFNAEKYMVWSIGITLCDFMFKTHSFIRDKIMDDVTRMDYTKYYKCDNKIIQFMSLYFNKLVNKGYTVLEKISACDVFTPDISDFLQKVLTLDFTKRSTLLELYNLPMFDPLRKTCLTKHVSSVSMSDAVMFGCKVAAPKVLQGVTDKKTIAEYNAYRGVMVNWLFQMYKATDKLPIFVHAVNLFDMFMAIETVEIDNFVFVICAAAYIAQYITRGMQQIDINVLVSSLSLSLGVQTSILKVQEVNKAIESVLKRLDYSLYRVTFDVIIAKQNIVIDMNTVYKVMTSVSAPYDNVALVRRYGLFAKNESLLQYADL